MEECTDPSFNHVKTIVRTNVLKRLDIHNHVSFPCKTITLPALHSEDSLQESPLHINHYAIQSRNFFCGHQDDQGGLG